MSDSLPSSPTSNPYLPLSGLKKAQNGCLYFNTSPAPRFSRKSVDLSTALLGDGFPPVHAFMRTQLKKALRTVASPPPHSPSARLRATRHHLRILFERTPLLAAHYDPYIVDPAYWAHMIFALHTIHAIRVAPPALTALEGDISALLTWLASSKESVERATKNAMAMVREGEMLYASDVFFDHLPEKALHPRENCTCLILSTRFPFFSFLDAKKLPAVMITASGAPFAMERSRLLLLHRENDVSGLEPLRAMLSGAGVSRQTTSVSVTSASSTLAPASMTMSTGPAEMDPARLIWTLQKYPLWDSLSLTLYKEGIMYLYRRTHGAGESRRLDKDVSSSEDQANNLHAQNRRVQTLARMLATTITRIKTTANIVSPKKGAAGMSSQTAGMSLGNAGMSLEIAETSSPSSANSKDSTSMVIENLHVAGVPLSARIFIPHDKWELYVNNFKRSHRGIVVYDSGLMRFFSPRASWVAIEMRMPEMMGWEILIRLSPSIEPSHLRNPLDELAQSFIK